MKLSRSALVYTALATCAIAAVVFVALRDPATIGGSLDTTAAAELRQGSMKKLNFHSQARATSELPFTTEDGGQDTLMSYQGKYILLNFWATWCAPCRKEMPMLSNLQKELGGEQFEVLTLATGRNMPQAMARFFDEIGVDNLPLHRDPRQAIAREMAVLGLPVTVILDPQGREIARLQGDADWDSPSAKAILRHLIGVVQ